MAKRRQVLDISVAEGLLGYKISETTYKSGIAGRFYSDLRLVPDKVEQLAQRELAEFRKAKTPIVDMRLDVNDGDSTPNQQVLVLHGGSITISKRSATSIYRSCVDVDHKSGFHLPLLLTDGETLCILAASAAGSRPRSPSRADTSPLFKLPRELRNQIYEFLLPPHERRLENAESFDSIVFPSSMGDPSGFLFSLGPGLNVLNVCRRIREEALPVAYRQLVFCLDDMDDVVKFLVSIGQIGRHSIESLEFPWKSRADSERRWDYVDPAAHYLTLPGFHVTRCVQLLRECKKLRRLRLIFEADVLAYISEESFKSNMGIQDLCSLVGIEVVEVWSPSLESLEHFPLAKWLQKQIQDT